MPSQTELASLTENNRAVLLVMLIEDDAQFCGALIANN
jgi:hypothetical protein